MSNIKIQDVFQRVQYSAASGQTQFSVPFPFFDNSYVLVWRNGILLQEGGALNQYIITGAGSPSGGTVTLNSGSNLGDIITIQGDMPIDRTSIYSPTISNLTGSDLNADFNREVVMLQQLHTTQALLQLQYAPWEQISQDPNVTTDRYIPILGPGEIWVKSLDGTHIETTIYNPTGNLKYINPVEAATTGNFSATYNNGTSGVGATLTATSNGALVIDGVNATLGMRFLFKDQTNNFENGVYEVVQIGDVSTPAIVRRTSDFDSPSDIVPGDLVPVLHGNTYANSLWIQTDVVNDVGTDPIQFVAFTFGANLPGGNSGSIQYNNAGDFGGDNNFTTDGSGNIAIAGSLEVDNIDIDGNTISLATGTLGLIAAELLASDTRTDATQKIFSITTPNYNNADGAFLGYQADSNLGDNIVNIGGGDANYNAATQISFFAAVDDITPPGTEIARIDIDGFHPLEGIVGVTNGSNADAGDVGELVSSSVPLGSAVSLTSTVVANVTSINLTAGDWDVTGSVLIAGTATSMGVTRCGINTVSATMPSIEDVNAAAGGDAVAGAPATIGGRILTTSTARISIASTTTVYLVATAQFSGGTGTAYGKIQARRVR